jgi:hypothetical protein
MAGRRSWRTIEKILAGALPGCTNDGVAIESGNRRRCDGCGDLLHEIDRMLVVLISGAARLRFHDGCYSVWTTLLRSESPPIA